MTDINWGGVILAILTLISTAVASVIGLMVARTNKDSNTAGKRIDASAAELATLSQLVDDLSQENRRQRGELGQARVEMQTWQLSAADERRDLGLKIINMQQSLLDVNTKVERQTALLFAVDREARRAFPQEWAAILAAVMPAHREAYLLIVPQDPAPLPPEADPATDPTS